MLSSADRRSVDRIIAELANLGEPTAFGPGLVGDEIRKLLRSPYFYAYDFRPAAACRLEVARCTILAEEGPARGRSMEREVRAFIRAQPGLDWTSHNPIRPAPSERNRPKRVRPADLPPTVPIVRLLKAISLEMNQCRVLPCEGASLLAWVGACRPEPFTSREVALLGALTPALMRRLRIERELAGASHLSLLEAVLDALGAPSFVVSRRGAICHANQAGMVLWARDARALAEDILHAIQHPERQTQIELTPLRYPGVEGYFLAIRRVREPGLAGRVEAAASTWGLTPRQTQVLRLLASGLTNKGIAAELGCAEVTVEFHVSALLERAQVENRAALVASTWSFEN